MKIFFARLIESTALWLRQSRWRVPLLKKLLSFDNFLRRWITFYSFEKNIHPKHYLTNYHQFFLDNISSHDSILDVGCGNGLLACDIAAIAKHVTGIDMNKDYLSQATGKTISAGLQNISFIFGDATAYQFNETFDVLILSNVLEHIKNRPAFLKKIKPIAKKLLIRVPMIDRDWLVLLKKEFNIEYRLDPTHFIEYTETLFRQELTTAGFSIINLYIRFGEIYCVAE